MSTQEIHLDGRQVRRLLSNLLTAQDESAADDLADQLASILEAAPVNNATRFMALADLMSRFFASAADSRSERELMMGTFALVTRETKVVKRTRQ